ncbi:MAG: hypothetical protein Q4C02_08230, partial [Eubacteriales bacterium]|nr:hypothetical protein [Eubacteriales bacterium]
LGYDRDYLLHVTDEDLGRKIYRALMAAHADREAIHRHILAQRAHYLEMLEEMGAFLKRYLQEGLQLQSF